jgi:hypothetical protein
MKITNLTPPISIPRFFFNKRGNIKNRSYFRENANYSTRSMQTGAAAWITLGMILGGCSTVPPWERGNLAKEHMALDPNPGQSIYREHIYGAREASSGGGSAKGGGCGCY